MTHYRECFMLSVTNRPFMLSVTNRPFMLSVIMLSVVVLNVAAPQKT
jgi:hypothetical protein